MLRRITLLISIVFVAAAWAMGQTYTACSDYNTIGPVDYWEPSGAQNHSSGAHYVYGVLTGSCSYTSVGLSTCASVCKSSGSVTMQDLGKLSGNPLLSHNIGSGTNGGGGSQARTAVSLLTAA